MELHQNRKFGTKADDFDVITNNNNNMLQWKKKKTLQNIMYNRKELALK